MLSKPEYNDLYRLLEVYSDAWEAYVRAFVGLTTTLERQTTCGMRVTEAKEQLLDTLRRLACSRTEGSPP